MKNITTAIIGLIILIVGALLSVGKTEELVGNIRKNKQEKQQKKKIKELCLRAGELLMLDGVLLLMKGFLVDFENHILALAILAWGVVACFDLLYVTVTAVKKKKRSQDKIQEIILERNERLAYKANRMGKILEEER